MIDAARRGGRTRDRSSPRFRAVPRPAWDAIPLDLAGCALAILVAGGLKLAGLLP